MFFDNQIDSLQRQLSLANSEVDNQQQVERTLLEERANLQHKNIQLSQSLKKCIAEIEDLKSSSNQNQEVQENWRIEKTSLQVGSRFLLTH